MAKKKVTFTVEEDVLNMFKSFSESNALNMSQWVENQMIKYIENEVIK